MVRMILAFLPLLLPLTSSAQVPDKHDPLVGHYVFANSAEVVHLTEAKNPQSILRHDLHDFLPNGQMGGPATGGTGDNLDLSGDRGFDHVAADVNGDGKDELVIARASASGTLELSISPASKVSGLDWTWNSTSVLEFPYDTLRGQLRLVAANLDWSPREELIMFYRRQDGYQFRVFDSLDAVTHLPVESYSLWVHQLTWNEVQTFDMTPGDFDRDGLGEILIAFHMAGTGWHSLSFRLFDYDPELRTGNWWPWGGMAMDDVPWGNLARLKVTAGDFRNRGQVDLVVSATATSGTNGRQVFQYVRVNPSTQDFSFEPPPWFVDVPSGSAWGSGWETHAVAADLNPMKKDGDELVVAGPGEFGVVKFNSQLKPYYLVRVILSDVGWYHPFEQRKFIDVADINADSASATWMPEIVLAQHDRSDSSTTIRTYGVVLNASDSIIGFSSLGDIAALHPHSPVSELVLGDFDGDAIRVGPPTLFMKNSFMQPLISLDIPPTHFDSLNGRSYDICKAYGSNTSQFKAKYSQTQSLTSKFSSQLGESWGGLGQDRRECHGLRSESQGKRGGVVQPGLLRDAVLRHYHDSRRGVFRIEVRWGIGHGR